MRWRTALVAVMAATAWTTPAVNARHVQPAGPEFASVVADLVPLCTRAGNVREFADQLKTLGWTYSLVRGEYTRQLPFGEVVVDSDDEFACIIRVIPSADAFVDVRGTIETWARANDPAANVLRLGTRTMVTGDTYILRAEGSTLYATLLQR